MARAENRTTHLSKYVVLHICSPGYPKGNRGFAHRLAGRIRYTGWMRTNRPSTRAEDAQLVQAARATVCDRVWTVGPPLTLADVADACGVSPRRLQRAFYRASEAPVTFKAMVAAERMNAARGLLRRQLSITVREAAARVGYRDVAQFARAYRERFGLTPAADRADAGGRHRGGRLGGAAVSGRTRRERTARLEREASYRDAHVRATVEIFDLSDEEAEKGAEIAATQGLSAFDRWATRVFKARLALEQAEAWRRTVMLETSLILRRHDHLDPWEDEVEVIDN